MIYWLKCRFWRRYNVVYTSLSPTWHDKDYIMLYACFQLLVDFIEKEKPWELTESVYEAYKEYDEDNARQRQKDWDELYALYIWWKGRNDDSNYDTDTKMLHRLVELRGHLWT